MNMTSKTVITALTALTLAACGGGDAPSTSSPEPATNATSTPAPKPAQTAMTPVQRGERLYKRCVACHTLGEGEKHKVGPNLYGFLGAPAASKEGFNFSKAMAASGITWTDETLDAYLERPSKYIPGNRMSFVGLKKAEDRAAVIAYLKLKTGAEEG